MKLRKFIKNEIVKLAELYFAPTGTPGTKAKKIKPFDLLNLDTSKDTSTNDVTPKGSSEDETPRNWSKASDKEIRRIGGDVYYGDIKNKKPIRGKQRM